MADICTYIPAASSSNRILTLNPLQSIAFTGTVGYGLFIGSGKTLLIAGPGGAIAAFLVVGAIAVCVMEGISQMIMWWPIPNGMVEFVGEFVDRDLGTVVGVAYWYVHWFPVKTSFIRWWRITIRAGILMQLDSPPSILRLFS